MGPSLMKSDYRLNWQGTFINVTKFNIYRFNEKVDYPTNEDITIFQLIKNHNTYQYQHVQNLYTDLVHPLYPKEYT